MPALIRLARTSDAAALLAIYAPIVRETAISFEVEVPTEDAFQARVGRTLERHPWLVCEVDGRVAGYAYAGPHRLRAAYQWATEPSVYVHPDHQRKNVARALYTALFGVLRLQGFCQAYAGVVLPNEASTRLHEALGFRPVGVYCSVGYKRGRWHDVAWWQRPLQPDSSAPPSRLRTPDEVNDQPAWLDALRQGAALVRS